MKSWASKDPNEVDYRWVSWANDLASGQTIATSDFILVEGNVVIDSESLATPIATVWLSGGTAGEVCVLTNRVTTSDGRTLDQSVRLTIRDK